MKLDSDVKGVGDRPLEEGFAEKLDCGDGAMLSLPDKVAMMILAWEDRGEYGDTAHCLAEAILRAVDQEPSRK